MTPNPDLSIFKDYDIRGVYPIQINSAIAAKIAHAMARHFRPKSVAICRDMRLSGEEIRDALATTFITLGVDVYDAGLAGTEIQYFIAGTYSYDLVLMISASHNPPEYNGLKVALKGPVAVTSSSGLYAVRDLLGQPPLPDAPTPGKKTSIDVFDGWKKKIISLVNIASLKPLSIVVDAGNGMAGKLVPIVFNEMPFTVTPLYFQLDGRFPNHVPNPLIEKNTETLRKKVVETNAAVGFAFDGDADRTFLVDDRGRMVSGTITTALLTMYLLKKNPGATILYNAICGRIVPQIVENLEGKSKRVRVGHSYIKQYMKETGAIFAGEHSGHYYYRDYFMAESGVLTVLMILELLSGEDKPLSVLVDELNVYPASGEINFAVSDATRVIEEIKKTHADAETIDELDGVSVWYKNYWFNVRASKTEPLLRLNVEADDVHTLDMVKKKLVEEITNLGGKKE